MLFKCSFFQINNKSTEGPCLISEYVPTGAPPEQMNEGPNVKPYFYDRRFLSLQPTNAASHANSNANANDAGRDRDQPLLALATKNWSHVPAAAMLAQRIPLGTS